MRSPMTSSSLRVLEISQSTAFRCRNPSTDRAELRLHKYRGGCHCGSVRWALRSEFTAPDLPVRACRCEFCRKHGALSTSNANGEMNFTVQGPGQVIRCRANSSVGSSPSVARMALQRRGHAANAWGAAPRSRQGSNSAEASRGGTITNPSGAPAWPWPVNSLPGGRPLQP